MSYDALVGVLEPGTLQALARHSDSPEDDDPGSYLERAVKEHRSLRELGEFRSADRLLKDILKVGNEVFAAMDRAVSDGDYPRAIELADSEVELYNSIREDDSLLKRDANDLLFFIGDIRLKAGKTAEQSGCSPEEVYMQYRASRDAFAEITVDQRQAFGRRSASYATSIMDQIEPAMLLALAAQKAEDHAVAADEGKKALGILVELISAFEEFPGMEAKVHRFYPRLNVDPDNFRQYVILVQDIVEQSGYALDILRARTSP